MPSSCRIWWASSNFQSKAPLMSVTAQQDGDGGRAVEGECMEWVEGVMLTCYWGRGKRRRNKPVKPLMAKSGD
ncbi:hypothetical protein ACFX12_022025 [Malus domestica]